VCLTPGRTDCTQRHVVKARCRVALAPAARGRGSPHPRKGSGCRRGRNEADAGNWLPQRLEDQPNPQARGYDDERHSPDELGGPGLDSASDQRHDLGADSPRAHQPDHNCRHQPSGVHGSVTSESIVLRAARESTLTLGSVPIRQDCQRGAISPCPHQCVAGIYKAQIGPFYICRAPP
jgi:hypothetical protein